ncbi:MAG: TfoX/Sxy family protein [Tabrizicola sp.]|jgi:hypothetical protein|nr:TfoX/Sxy family protein [Tabrizicola sp.]
MDLDPALAQALRSDLAQETVTEKPMFGGLCFLSNGHMICGLHKGGTMYRVGKHGQTAALGLPGTRAMTMGNRPMRAMVELSLEDSTDPRMRHPLITLALGTVRALPPMVAKPKKR